MGDTAQYVMVGGFLGAGKTTALARLAARLSGAGTRVGLICNDQSTGLVDTTVFRSRGFQVEEITGGCFCCRFGSLLEAAERLTRATRPDVFLAEPVGSCTDLVATVSYPLRRIYGDRFTVAPLSVLVDPIRAARILGLAPGRSFSETVSYVYRKQLEEADFIVINKADATDPALVERLDAAIGDRFPRATRFVCSARTGEGTGAWFEALRAAGGRRPSPLEIDYDLYAEGEARLGWLNSTLRLTADHPFDGNEVLLWLAERIRDGVAHLGVDLAHLKMTLDPADGTGTVAVASVVGADREPDLRELLLDRVDGGELVVNLRAETDPEALERITRAACADLEGVRADVEHLERLRPGRPVPTHRMSS